MSCGAGPWRGGGAGPAHRHPPPPPAPAAAPPAERAAAVALADELGGLPLALEQAGAYITAHQSRFPDYLATFRRRQLDLLEAQGPEAGDYDRTVATTWAINFDAVHAE